MSKRWFRRCTTFLGMSGEADVCMAWNPGLFDLMSHVYVQPTLKRVIRGTKIGNTPYEIFHQVIFPVSTFGKDILQVS